MLESKWEGKNISFSLDIEEIYFAGNDDLLSQVWLNLLDNAIKFTPNGGSISIIRDNGCGIGKEAASHIFDKFYQEDISRAGEGNGLGLTLSNKIVELHGGTISCHSEENRGTEFVIQLPLK